MKKAPKRICLISVEIFAYGKYGGFGKATRTIGAELSKRGYEVFAVVPRREDQKPEEDIDGINVLSYTQAEMLQSGSLYKKINADIYHSCEPSFGTWLARKHVPGAKHIATIRDPRDAHDWYLEFLYPSKSKWQVIKNYLYETNWIVRQAVRKNDGVFSPAKFMLPKIRKIYGLKQEPVFLPTPVLVPEQNIKSELPQVLMMSRLDPRKRPEMILSLAEKFPYVHFHVAGKSRVPEYEAALRQKYNAQNVTFHGFVDQFRSPLHHELMEKSWILANAAIREGLPNSYLEAVAHQTAILSYVNPDDFASSYGFHAAMDNFEQGLSSLLKDHHWKQQAAKGYTYVRNTFAVDKAMDAHEEIYSRVCSGSGQI
jgi:glycosyltransferase involved in cell wall biosynthesis